MSSRNKSKQQTPPEIITKTISLPGDLAIEAQNLRLIKTRTENLTSELDWSKYVRGLIREDLKQKAA